MNRRRSYMFHSRRFAVRQALGAWAFLFAATLASAVVITLLALYGIRDERVVAITLLLIGPPFIVRFYVFLRREDERRARGEA